MNRYPFAVCDEVYCVWDHDLATRNRRFLASLDPRHFGYVTERHVSDLEGEHRQRAAVALRLHYHHGLEALFSLIGALTQAPDCVPAWLPKCSNSALRELVTKLRHGAPVLTQRGRQGVTLPRLAEFVHSYCWPDDEPAGVTGRRFGRLWNLLADDFLEVNHVAEYNSLKHGFRIGAGGFVLRIGLEHEYGVAPPESEMETVGGSPFGTTFFVPEPVADGPGGSRHFRIRRLSLNWRAEAVAQALQLIESSINNVVGALRCLSGEPPETVQFLRPADPSAFDAPWTWSVGVTSSNLDTVVDQAQVVPVSKAELAQELAARSPEDAAYRSGGP